MENYVLFLPVALWSTGLSASVELLFYVQWLAYLLCLQSVSYTPFFLQGKIACANVLSDLYAMGVSECDNMLMLLGISEKFTHTERQVVAPMMIEGFTGEWDEL